ncbi:cytochrome c-type biogenesis protein [Psychrosphaera aquimarina]|uniref:Cytochrome c-type biogenesis protein n=1 Tax=Psychrosphaera aquimarina TaxID=2044854 RepID=A0ABU3R582_9GAMM|nr:cytochrome c-type biogenesis protein [Psychrosphaera aquimarina]MDU0114620.1 cytochrome c-type biogenesis protein [Psychrosphaera aquimarina]
MNKFVITIGLLLLSNIAQATTEDQISFKSEQQKQLYLELTAELRCPKCQNQNIADSNAVVAKDMRVKTKQLLDEGQNKQQVIDYMINRYGQFAHYQPPFNAATSMLWLLPIGFILFAGFVQVKRSKSKQQVDEPTNLSDLDDELAQLLVSHSNNKIDTSASNNATIEANVKDIK